MFCRHCGNKVEKDDLFCRACGTKVVHVVEENIEADSKPGKIKILSLGEDFYECVNTIGRITGLDADSSVSFADMVKNGQPFITPVKDIKVAIEAFDKSGIKYSVERDESSTAINEAYNNIHEKITADNMRGAVKKATDTVSNTAKTIGVKINEATGGKASEIVQTAQEKAKETARSYSADVKQAVDSKDVKSFFTKNRFRNAYISLGIIVVLIFVFSKIFGGSSKDSQPISDRSDVYADNTYDDNDYSTDEYEWDMQQNMQQDTPSTESNVVVREYRLGETAGVSVVDFDPSKGRVRYKYVCGACGYCNNQTHTKSGGGKTATKFVCPKCKAKTNIVVEVNETVIH